MSVCNIQKQNNDSSVAIEMLLEHTFPPIWKGAADPKSSWRVLGSVNSVGWVWHKCPVATKFWACWSAFRDIRTDVDYLLFIWARCSVVVFTDAAKSPALALGPHSAFSYKWFTL